MNNVITLEEQAFYELVNKVVAEVKSVKDYFFFQASFHF